MDGFRKGKVGNRHTDLIGQHRRQVLEPRTAAHQVNRRDFLAAHLVPVESDRTVNLPGKAFHHGAHHGSDFGEGGAPECHAFRKTEGVAELVFEFLRLLGRKLNRPALVENGSGDGFGCDSSYSDDYGYGFGYVNGDGNGGR